MRKPFTEYPGIIKEIEDNIGKFFIGKQKQVQYLLVGFLAGLHVLIEDIPGVGKTTLAKCLAASVNLSFSRIQFTPDLLPGDILGMNIWDQEKREFVFKTGAIQHQFILADEINRTSPRTQASLLEAMQEETVSIDGKTYPLPRPFFVIATQNPENFTGTFPLPEAELDRFGLSFSLGYASNQEELKILGMHKYTQPIDVLKPVTTPEVILTLRQVIAELNVTMEIKEFVIRLANKIRSSQYIKLGVSTRALLHLITAARALALIRGRDFVIPEDIMDLVVPVLGHRIILSTEAHMEHKSPADVLTDFVITTPVPTGRK